MTRKFDSEFKKSTRQTGKLFQTLVDIITQLRAPDGCPWDREQTHTSLLKYLKEESAEVVRAIKRNDDENLEEELGDLLLQVLLHAQIGRERKQFNINHIMEILKHKLVKRHPHVFNKKSGINISTAQDVRDQWKKLKVFEKKSRKKIFRRKNWN